MSEANVWCCYIEGRFLRSPLSGLIIHGAHAGIACCWACVVWKLKLILWICASGLLELVTHSGLRMTVRPSQSNLVGKVDCSRGPDQSCVSSSPMSSRWFCFVLSITFWRNQRMTHRTFKRNKNWVKKLQSLRFPSTCNPSDQKEMSPHF